MTGRRRIGDPVPGDLWTELKRRQDVLLARIADHEILCAAATPDQGALTRSRWQVAHAGRHRMEWLNAIVFPFALDHCSGFDLGELQRLRDETLPYQRYVSDCVSTWTIAKIIADWDVYRHASVRFRDAIRARVAREVAVLRLVLPRAELNAATIAAQPGSVAAA